MKTRALAVAACLGTLLACSRDPQPMPGHTASEASPPPAATPTPPPAEVAPAPAPEVAVAPPAEPTPEVTVTPPAPLPPPSTLAPVTTPRPMPAPPAVAPAPRRDPSLPAAPVELAALPVSDREIAVTWTAAPEGAPAVVYEVTPEEGRPQRVKEPGFRQTGLTARTTRCFSVRALDRAGHASPAAGPVCATTPDLTPPGAPADVVATADGERAADLRWAVPADDVGVVRYEVLREEERIAQVDAPQARETRLDPATRYCWTVVALDAAGNRSAASAPACAETPDLTPPAPPPAARAVAASDRRVDVRWDPADDEVGVTEYEVERQDGGVHVTAAEQWADTGVAPARTYCYAVRARDAAGNRSGPSASVCAKTPDLEPPSLPESPAAAAVSTRRAELTWRPSTDDVGVVRYEVLRDRTVAAKIPAPTTAIVLSGLPAGTQLCFAVRAVDAAGNASAAAGPACTRTAAEGPEGPTALRATATATGVELTWEPSPDPEVTYAIYGTSGDRMGVTRAARFAVPPISSRTHGCFQVTALDREGRESPRTLAACAAPGRVAGR